jgi:hypothetical protein
MREQSSGSGESAAVHSVQLDLASFSDGAGESDHDPAVGRTVETLPVSEGDGSVQRQKEEARSTGGMLSQ